MVTATFPLTLRGTTNVPQRQATDATVFTAQKLFAGPGEMRAACRAHDWTATPLGAVETWPVSLRATAQLVLGAGIPMLLYWGPDLVQLFNDSFRLSLGEAAPIASALGAPADEFWTENWDVRGPQLRRVLSGGDVLRNADALILSERNGHREDVWWTYCDNPVHGDDGCIAGVLVTCQETTARVQAEREQVVLRRALADALPTLAWTARADGHVEWLNAQGYEYTGAAQGSMEGWGWQAVHDPVILPDVLARWNASLASGDAFEMTCPLRGADGSFQSFLTRIVPSRDTSGAVVRWIGTATNIESEQRLRLAAEQANRSKSDFLVVLSHELRTPLNAIDGYAELMELGIRGPVTDEQRHDLARIRRSEQHLLGLINGVLAYAQVEAGAVHYDMQPVSLDDVLTTCNALVAPQVRNRNLALVREPCDPALTVRADREKLQQIVLNLLSNAIKFTRAGGQIVLRCVCGADRDGSLLQIVVTDTGIGIEPSQLGRIFEPFVQVNTELTRTREGTGLGLAISRDLARGMGGDLTAESEPGRGSAFTLMLRSE